ncbi:MAG TPA: TatD family hydrolase, partial [Candidatus Andersenbacteria bacterium]|nr:TatD family hydrolase [Candidatus Andersenbacteria bacterium]
MFDSHAHMMDTAFDNDRELVMQKIFESNISGWMEVGTSVEESKKAIALAETDHRIIASVGVHPHALKNLKDADWDEIQQLAGHKKCKAIGEVGLDFSRGNDIEFQEAMLKKFISLAQQKNLPLIFHVRNGNSIDAHAELLRILSSYNNQNLRGVIHTFSGTLIQAQEYIKLGMMISFSGVLTFKNSGE